MLETFLTDRAHIVTGAAGGIGRAAEVYRFPPD